MFQNDYAAVQNAFLPQRSRVRRNGRKLISLFKGLAGIASGDV
jgi:hypothetical protein